MTATAPPRTATVEAIDFQRNGSTGTGFYTAIVSDVVDGVPSRFLVQFARANPETSAIEGILEDKHGCSIAFVSDLDAIHAGDLTRGLRGHDLTLRWIPILEQARKDKEAFDRARDEQEAEERKARAQALAAELLARTGLPSTDEYLKAARGVLNPFIRTIPDERLGTWKTAIIERVKRGRQEQG